MENLEMISFKIISSVGMAKSSFMEAIYEAKAGNFESAHAKIKEGEDFFVEGHHAHSSLLTQEASGETVVVSLILMHAEDQLMSAETIKLFALELIDLYEKLGINQ